MSGSTINPRKKRRGRPPVDSEQVNVRLPRETLDSLDVWIAKQLDPKPSRTEAIRIGLRDWLAGMGIMPLRDTGPDE